MHNYDIVISFAGEDRSFASKLAKGLATAGVRVFYDEYEQANLWGKDLYEYLADIYANHARFCVMLLSENYARKLWTNHERRNAQERAFREREEYILPVRLDDTQIPGIRNTVGYIDLRTTTISDLVEMIVAKLGESVPASATRVHNPEAVDFDIPMPRVKRSFTQLEKDRFVKAAFKLIADYFRRGIERVSRLGDGLEGDFTEVGPLKFVAKIYHHGEVVSQCKIWLGGMFSQDSICYSESFYDLHNDSSMNDWLSIHDDGRSLFFVPSGMGIGYGRSEEKNLNENQAAEYLWGRFTARISS